MPALLYPIAEPEAVSGGPPGDAASRRRGIAVARTAQAVLTHWMHGGISNLALAAGADVPGLRKPEPRKAIGPAQNESERARVAIRIRD
jgi:hypothetical protein